MKKKKQITGYIKLQVPAGSANPAPPIGPALGQRGVNIAEFCKQFNDATKDQEKGVPLPTVITVFGDKSFSFEVKAPPVSFFVKRAAGLQSASKLPGRDVAGKITMEQVTEIAKKKAKDMGLDDYKSGESQVIGSARSMGIIVENKE